MTGQLAAATLTFALLLSAERAAAEESYTLDPLHSQPRYEIQHMRGLSTQTGYFNKVNGKVTLDFSAFFCNSSTVLSSSFLNSRPVALV